MQASEIKVSGGCHCGNVRYQAKGKPVYVPICHCESCRRSTGAPVVAYVMFHRKDVSFTQGEPNMYSSSPGVRRSFCSNCGTPLTWEANWGGKEVMEVHISTLDNPEIVSPDRHVFFAERLSYVDFADNLPRFFGTSVDVEPNFHGPASGNP